MTAVQSSREELKNYVTLLVSCVLTDRQAVRQLKDMKIVNGNLHWQLPDGKVVIASAKGIINEAILNDDDLAITRDSLSMYLTLVHQVSQIPLTVKLRFQFQKLTYKILHTLHLTGTMYFGEYETEDWFVLKAAIHQYAKLAIEMGQETLVLEKSRIIDGVLFIASNDLYYVIDPQNKDAIFMTSPTLDLKDAKYEGTSFTQAKTIYDTLKSWVGR